ncbi:MAG TPA: hypothetical protein VMF67_09005 [Rhizomicrobium sp.]|nr:hypothetical protein [Rhizomicrobium sp.]
MGSCLASHASSSPAFRTTSRNTATWLREAEASFRRRQVAEEVRYAFCGGRHSCNGLYPLAGLIDVHGRFYGTTGGGGGYIADGTVFSLREKR